MSLHRAGGATGAVIGAQFATNPPVAALTVLTFVIGFIGNYLWDFDVSTTIVITLLTFFGLSAYPLVTICLYALSGVHFWLDFTRFPEVHLFISFVIIYFFTSSRLFKNGLIISEREQASLRDGWLIIGIILFIIWYFDVSDISKSISGWTFIIWFSTMLLVFYVCKTKKDGLFEVSKYSKITTFVLSLLFTYWFYHIASLIIPKHGNHLFELMKSTVANSFQNIVLISIFVLVVTTIPYRKLWKMKSNTFPKMLINTFIILLTSGSFLILVNEFFGKEFLGVIFIASIFVLFFPLIYWLYSKVKSNKSNENEPSMENINFPSKDRLEEALKNLNKRQ